MLSSKRWVIATRASRLAVWQAKHVQTRLLDLYPACQVELLILTTRGDQILDRSLSKIGGKGLFVKELEKALLDGRADIAVHSLKDVPVDLSSEFELSTILARGDPRDAFVSNRYLSLEQLPVGAVVGTSSLRREAMVRAAYPYLTVKPLRGNLDTRLSKLDKGEFDAIVLAAVGLQRLGLSSRISRLLETTESLPAAGQGALGIEICSEREELRDWLVPMACRHTTACVLAERAVSREIGGSCQVPLAAYAQYQDEKLYLQACLASPDGQQIIRTEQLGLEPQALGRAAAQDLLSKGAAAIMFQLRQALS